MVSLMRLVSPGDYHPPVDDKPLPRSRRGLFWLMVVVFAAVFMPVPWRLSLAGAEAQIKQEQAKQAAQQAQQAQQAQKVPVPVPAPTPPPPSSP